MDPTPRAIWIVNVSTPLCTFAHKISRCATSSYAAHEHDFYELIYVVSGEVEFFVDGQVCAIGPGTLLTFPPGLRHGVLVRTNAPYERYTLHFDPKCLSVDRRLLLLSSLPDGLTSLGAGEPGEAVIWREMEHSGILQTMEAMEALQYMDVELASRLVPVYVEAALAALLARPAGEKHRNREQDIRASSQQREIIAWVEQHYTEPITLESLAERFFLSKGHLNSLFRQATGVTVKAYVQTKRLNHVHMLLAAGVPAAQAASRTGFGDYTTFYRAYVRAFGQTPSEARRGRARDSLLADALTAERFQRPERAGEGLVFPHEGTEREDPSMLHAIRLGGETPRPDA